MSRCVDGGEINVAVRIGTPLSMRAEEEHRPRPSDLDDPAQGLVEDWTKHR